MLLSFNAYGQYYYYNYNNSNYLLYYYISPIYSNYSYHSYCSGTFKGFVHEPIKNGQVYTAKDGWHFKTAETYYADSVYFAKHPNEVEYKFTDFIDKK